MAQLPDPYKTLSAELAKLREEIRQLRNRSPYTGTGLKPTAEGEMTVEGNLVVTGDFTAQGKISTEALVNPVKPDVSSDFGTAWGASTTYAVKMTRTWAVPAGFNVAQISGAAKVFAFNNSGAADYIYARSKIVRVSDGAASYGYGTPQPVDAGTYGMNVGLTGAYVGVADGDSIQIQVEVRTELAAWPAFAGNVAEWTGAISWYRL